MNLRRRRLRIYVVDLDCGHYGHVVRAMAGWLCNLERPRPKKLAGPFRRWTKALRIADTLGANRCSCPFPDAASDRPVPF